MPQLQRSQGTENGERWALPHAEPVLELLSTRFSIGSTQKSFRLKPQKKRLDKIADKVLRATCCVLRMLLRYGARDLEPLCSSSCWTTKKKLLSTPQNRNETLSNHSTSRATNIPRCTHFSAYPSQAETQTSYSGKKNKPAPYTHRTMPAQPQGGTPVDDRSLSLRESASDLARPSEKGFKSDSCACASSPTLRYSDERTCMGHQRDSFANVKAPPENY